IRCVVDNVPVTIFYNQPAPNTRLRDTANVTVIASELLDHATFTVGSTTLTASRNGLAYSAAVPLAGLPDGAATITATAYGVNGELVTADLVVIVDRTPP